MKKIFLLFFILSGNIVSGQNSYKQNLDSLASVVFPVKPTLKTTGTYTIYSTTVKSNFYSVLIQKIDFKLEQDSLDVFYGSVMKGNLESAKGKLISRKNVVIDGLKAIEFNYVATNNPNVPDTRFQKLVFMNGKLFNFLFWTPADSVKSSAKLRDSFFNSIVITADKENIKQYNGKGRAFDLGYSAGYLIGKAFAFGVLACLVAGIILLIRRIALKKKKNQQ